jgi:hypothetical protein
LDEIQKEGRAEEVLRLMKPQVCMEGASERKERNPVRTTKRQAEKRTERICNYAFEYLDTTPKKNK